MKRKTTFFLILVSIFAFFSCSSHEGPTIDSAIISGIELFPDFDSSVSNYTAEITETTQSISILPKLDFAKYKLGYSFNGSDFQNVKMNETLSFSEFSEGTNALILQVSDTTKTQMYRIAIKNGYDLLINETGAPSSYSSSIWIELYNPTNRILNLKEYSLSTQYLDLLSGKISTVYHFQDFELPEIIIQPNNYYVVRGKIDEESQNSAFCGFIKNNNRIPYFMKSGSIELKHNDVGTDFVRFGDSSALPKNSSLWLMTEQSGAPSLTSDEPVASIARDGISFDSNSSADWKGTFFATPGGANDVINGEDLDQDGIPDSSEIAGGTFSGLPLYQWGARKNQKDIFLHIDYMASNKKGIIPSREALEIVTKKFKENGYFLHINTGELYSEYNLDKTSHERAYQEKISLNELYSLKQQQLHPSIIQIFHYLLFADTFIDEESQRVASGIAELGGNDLMVALGPWLLTDQPTASPLATAVENLNRLINLQASTIMHELGHNLGLRHGGNNNVNYKPNYMSIMNYLYQLDGLPDENNNGDRYLKYKLQRFLNGLQVSPNIELFPITDLITFKLASGSAFVIPPTQNIFSATFQIDYSHGRAPELNEAMIATGSHNTDYNLDGSIEQSTGFQSIDLNDDGITTTLTDYNDWDNLQLISSEIKAGIKLKDSRSIDTIPIHDTFDEKRPEISVDSLPLY